MSDCGGFDHDSGRARAEDMDLETYCEAERLFVSYDAEAATMTLELRRTHFNCCTLIDSEVIFDEDGAYLLDLHEDYLPEADAICGCSCIFDVDATVEEVTAGEVLIRAQKRFHDDPPWIFVDQTVLLGPEPVEIVINDYPAYQEPCGTEM